MARQHINITVPYGPKGDSLRVGGKKINENFIELYDLVDNGGPAIVDMLFEEYA